jgi:hypothetical protein
MDSTKPDFWEQRYLSGRTPWDFQGVPPALVDFLRRSPGIGSVLLPGCGTGYEVKAFHESGWRPLAIDFSPAAVHRAREVLGLLAPAVKEADFFDDSLDGPFDLIYERTFLCSLPPERWAAYAERAVQLLRPGGALTGIFYYGVDPEGPPFPIREDEARVLFAAFELVEDHAIPADRSLPLFAGYERWQTWRLNPR